MKKFFYYPCKKAVLTLCCAFLYFDISFAVWVILGAIGTFIAGELKLTPVQKGIMVALPILSGSLLRILFGLAESVFGGKKTALIGMGITAACLLWGGLSAHSLKEIYGIGLLLGISGASFAVALPMASRWFSSQNQGLVLGLTGSGNSGTLLCTLFGPMIAHAYGWHSVFIFFLLLLGIVFLVFLLLAEDAPQTQREKLDLYALSLNLRQLLPWLLAFLYSLSFGGFVGLASYLGFFLVDDYRIDKVEAGKTQTLIIAAGSLLRPLGGALADKVGGAKLLLALLATSSLLAFLPSFYFPFLAEIILLFCLMGCLGLANGAVFQLVGSSMSSCVGIITGVVGAAGGIGGFFLPILLGKVKEHFGSCALGFLFFSFFLFVGSCLAFALVFSERLNKSLRVENPTRATASASLIPFSPLARKEGSEK
ncbi:MFS transporter [Candidatus Methylacidiphilum infernorum]|uniref:Nitrate/nitrite transporter n=1 Tax=Methylacidiphilum infernorum (isolate V4) TaxID=481448 RepID=B3DUZ3_METI4|nr:MFS transporter [Candidatus Methylacidiphilum infernorum]ACD83146.1 Nitrate/nitrite transporter [Methylacidiphilum infernorum V4]